MYVNIESQLQSHASSDRHLIRKQIALWGSPLSEALLDPVYQIFRTPEIDGFIGYRIEAGCAVSFGNPVCPKENVSCLLSAFHRYCSDQKLNPIYIGVSDDFAHWALEDACKVCIEFGELLVCDPSNYDPTAGSKGRLIRNKKRRAHLERIEVKEYLQQDPKLEVIFQNMEQNWLNSRRGPQIYISHLNLASNREGKRLFYAVKDGNIIGLLLLSRLEAQQGWLIYRLMAIPKAAKATTEQLVLSAMEILHNEGCRYLNLGALPASSLKVIKGVGPFTSALIKGVYRVIKFIFPLDRLRKFWEKFHAQNEPVFLLFSHSHIGLKEIRGLMKALNVSL